MADRIELTHESRMLIGGKLVEADTGKVSEYGLSVGVFSGSHFEVKYLAWPKA